MADPGTGIVLGAVLEDPQFGLHRRRRLSRLGRLQVDQRLGQRIGSGIHHHVERTGILIEQGVDDEVGTRAGLARTGVGYSVAALTCRGDAVQVRGDGQPSA